jgi:hypothetical protein
VVAVSFQYSGFLNPAGVPITSSNQDGGKETKEHTLMAKKKNPVLNSTLYSFRKKQDIIDEIRVSTNTLGLSRSDTSLVFYRSTVDEQVKVSMKALAYVELIITSTCVHLLKSSKFVGNPVKSYLNTLSLSQLVDLKKDVEAALGHCEDSNRYMAVYSGGSDFAKRIRKQCFDKKLHARLGCHSLHSIPIGFYYAKWSESFCFIWQTRLNRIEATHVLRRRAPAHHLQRWHQPQRAVRVIHRAAHLNGT